WQDTVDWEFVSMDSRLIRKGYTPPIRQFSMETASGEDVHDFFLQDSGFSFILVVRALQKTPDSVWPAVRTIDLWAGKHGINFIGLSAASPDQTEIFRTEHKLPFDFLYGDAISLKTMIRSNPGLILLHNGTIIRKWHYHDFPSVELLRQLTSFP
ncbi:MAG: hypothetical protein AB7D05_10735, partial [Mangrovibacterium sp.]